MTTDESDAIEAFERLGLTSYEAKVFIALQQLGSGSAREIADVADVPRSQVYSVAESLEGRGLLEVQQSNPIRYRPVSVDEARETLRDRFENEQERAFEYVETVREETAGEEAQEDIWTIRDRDRVDDRVVDVLSRADDRIVFGTRLPELVTDEIERTLEERAAAGVEVTTISRSATVRDRFESLEDVRAYSPPRHRTENGDDRSGRIALVDDDTVLLSVVDDDGSETAIWSASSLFASVLIQLIEASTETPP
ncbi:TrmB family transcriptional regulator [Natrialbaceae archaeon AArc-T1-2]|uniref:TrmB family transcriptional regulator n=1 Tax=Natrialbaceae archaeon AArc-T1-2 TaxID=3053904 RepID=UPI00255A9CB7|nr:helix-turn-helix domain-containing protein [Natrialbaceae archaeon AArc-T1-2]WIV67206.1 helix-turn-helix domain-containing protein [Natrialbaceae archaeon AArc-T1-2]